MVKGRERIDVSSTSKAAQLARSEGVGAAAIASRVAADVHGLKVLARNIEDTADNTTRFFILARTPGDTGNGGGEDGGGAGGGKSLTKPTTSEGRRDKTLLCFTCDHEQPGALCDSLKVFKDKGLNLTSITSRPSRRVPWHYIFFVEFVGHEEEEAVQEALKELEQYCSDLRVLGSYEDKSRDKR